MLLLPLCFTQLSKLTQLQVTTMKFLAVLVLLGVSIFLVSAQSPTTAAPADTYPATGPADDEAPDAETTAAATTATTTAATTATTTAATTATTTAATTATTAAPTTATTAASTTARKDIPVLPKWIGDLLNGRVCP
ncbi:mucin-like protein 1 [Gorilla gorilla gorilla]|uniref:mucin-like protein 1 n=1 Tax=Gorilla gorilla gorilla TaxID=9595 RepID=UPI00123E9353|nr:mucin-like protein 1 [Gorilla gorilla gorilla]